MLLGDTNKFSTPKKSDSKLENSEKQEYFVSPETQKRQSDSLYDTLTAHVIPETRIEKLKSYLKSKFEGKEINPNYVSNFFRAFSILMIPISALSPSAVSCYWATSGLTAIAVNLTLLSPKVQNLVRIPRLPEDSDTPYKDVLNNMKTRAKKIFRLERYYKTP